MILMAQFLGAVSTGWNNIDIYNHEPSYNGWDKVDIKYHFYRDLSYPDSKVHGASMGPTWGRQDPGGPNVGPTNLAIWVYNN